MTRARGGEAAKRDLRHAARARRARLTAGLDRDAAGRAIVDAVLPLVPDRGRVAVYESLPTEPPTGPLIEALLAAGHEVIVPVTLADYSLDWRYAAAGAVGDAATLTRHAPGDVTGTLGPEALASCSLVVTPGLAVDRHGVRLGQGGGCYDRALAHRDPAVPVITLLHEGEASDVDLPCDHHDQLVDGYATTTGRLVRLTERPTPRD
ncbi:MAG TPA: 5-formyltetrahydrofolate cyclo-ligase [Intrasporangium sp.]|uniref:5-formyltetrahydrofolate cyclo-ligase n=1 Tax=Intrasporangium sp. TaxID=1925024 RepID=UPI002D792739|nr:5-formyltetrahydrofolate cyclo-ligase [Intrasporangium sp.]HET7397824.1 5-formyltetrahydrofolate cyclo-ligase [Intrasporangium sp.]